MALAVALFLPAIASIALAALFWDWCRPGAFVPRTWPRVLAVGLLYGGLVACVAHASFASVSTSTGETFAALFFVALVVVVKLAADRLSSWSRFVWLPVSTGLGLLWGGFALYWTAFDEVRVFEAARESGAAVIAFRSLLQSAWAPVFVAVWFGVALGWLLVSRAAARRAVSWMVRTIGVVSACASAWLTVEAVFRLGPSQPSGGYLYTRVPHAFVALAGAGVVAAALVLVVGAIGRAERRKRLPVAESGSPRYREPAPVSDSRKDLDREAAAREAEELLRLRYEVLAVALVGLGLGPLLAVAMGGTFW